VDHIFPTSITIGVGGSVRFFASCNSDIVHKPTTDTVDIVFDDPTVTPDGPVLIPGIRKIVPINQEGVFHYHSVRYGFSGTIISSSGPP